MLSTLSMKINPNKITFSQLCLRAVLVQNKLVTGSYKWGKYMKLRSRDLEKTLSIRNGSKKRFSNSKMYTKRTSRERTIFRLRSVSLNRKNFTIKMPNNAKGSNLLMKWDRSPINHLSIQNLSLWLSQIVNLNRK
jgi:hypothetical protein